MAPSTPMGGPASGKGILTATSLSNLNPADPAANAKDAASNESKVGAPISPANTVALHQLVTGCKVFVERPEPEGPRKAEILSIRQARQARLSKEERRAKRDDQRGIQMEYYVHYVEFNKRLDEWVSSTRLLLNHPVEWPSSQPSSGAHGSHAHHSPSPAPSKAPRPDTSLRKTAMKNVAQKAPLTKSQQQKRKKLRLSNSVASPSPALADEDMSMAIDSPTAASRSVSLGLDRESSADPTTPREGSPADEEEENDADVSGAVVAVELMDEDEDEDEDADADADPNEASAPNVLEKTSHFSKEQEIENLRTHGSMTQSVHEISRVKNLDRIQMGPHEVEAWYFSPYPLEYAHIPVLYICEFCLCFYGSPKMLERHRKKCTLLHPPGNEIYRHEEISFYEIDGKKQKTWCRNLCLLSKCFLDHKTLYYDVDPFLFYVMCKRDDMGVHIIGYLSKEKESAESYNLACILTLPQHQRHGYGKLLIEFSYELSKVEKKLGSPEKPLSDLGLLSYRAYWQEIIVDFIMERKGGGHDEVSIDEIANKTCIIQGDIMHTAQTLQMLKFYKNQHVLCVSDALIEQHERVKKKKRKRINPHALIWKPPHFSKEQLRFGF